jgi:hypothetical protein
MPFPGKPQLPKNIDDLVVLWLDAKRDEDAANARRIEIEAEICKLQPHKEEGATTIDLAGGAKLTLTGKLSYKCTDMAALQALALQLPPDRRPIKTEAKLDETGAKWLRSNAPDLWQIIAPAIEVKPAKTALKVGF